MSKKKEIKDELKNISPFVSEMDKKKSFKVPANYFDNLSKDILEEVFPKTEVQRSVKQRESWIDAIIKNIAMLFTPRVALSIASVAVLIVAAFLLFTPVENTETFAMDDLTVDEVTSYISANIDDFDEEMIMKFASENVNEKMFSPSELKDEDLDFYFNDLLDEIDEGDLEDLL